MSVVRFSAVISQHLPLFRQGLLARSIIAHGFATTKAKPVVVNTKRPATAYLSFYSEQLPKISEEYSALTHAEVSRIVTSRWHSMSEEEKKPYKDAYAEKMRIYKAPVNKLPKKPPGIFGLFVKEKYSSTEARNPGAKISDIMIEMSKEWKSLSETEKEKWIQERETLLQKYREELKSLGEQLSLEERAFLEKYHNRQLQKLKKEQRQLLGYPKRPPSPFILFSQRTSKGMEELTMTERSKMLGKKWREMPEPEKDIYYEENREAREKYEKDLEEWKEKYPKAL
ncbi:transcription factor A, mitochondrial-like [Montipora foliosa]|uniref:transcription factor A, mitochondrial-like n=1 Tax=Montipora foliosa TaxID=591990 RepID=UPI0035F1BCFF